MQKTPHLANKRIRTVAVETAVTCHPRTDPYVRNYRIRLLPRLCDAKRSSGKDVHSKSW